MTHRLIAPAVALMAAALGIAGCSSGTTSTGSIPPPATAAASTAAAGLFADVMDEVGQSIAAGGPNPEILGSGQSDERRQALADSITWINANCP